MKLIPTSEQEQLRIGVQRFVETLSPLSAVRAVMESDLGYDTTVWKRLCGELGIPALAVSENAGGAGFGMVELSMAMRECGAGLLPGPLFGSGVLCAQVLDALGETDTLAGVIDGTTIAALVRGSDLVVGEQGVVGTATGVIDAVSADVFLVVADETVHVVDAADPAVSRSPMVTLDPTRRQGTVEFRGARATAVGSAHVALQGIHRATVALAAEQVGAMRRVLDITVEYAKVREQFGRAIGSFQAVKQGLADMYASVELADSAVSYAAWVADNEPQNLPVAAALAAAYTGPAAFDAASQAIQYHGGIGYTWEHDAHLYYKRLKSSETLLGTTEEHLERIAAHLLDCEEVPV